MGLTYKQLVARGKKLAVKTHKLQWEWGDLALEVCPRTFDKERQDDQWHPERKISRRLRLFIQDTECPYAFNTLNRMRGVSHAWPKNRRVEAAWGVHDVLASDPDRFKLIKPGMTRREATDIATNRKLFSETSNGIPMDCEELIGAASRFLQAATRRYRSERVQAATLSRRLAHHEDCLDQLLEECGMLEEEPA